MPIISVFFFLCRCKSFIILICTFCQHDSYFSINDIYIFTFMLRQKRNFSHISIKITTFSEDGRCRLHLYYLFTIHLYAPPVNITFGKGRLGFKQRGNTGKWHLTFSSVSRRTWSLFTLFLVCLSVIVRQHPRTNIWTS